MPVDPAADSQSDQEIIARVLAGEVDRFEVLLLRHQAQVGRVVMKRVPQEDAPEVIQDAFVAAYRSLEGFRGAQPLEHWLSTIAVRACYDYWRQRYRRKEVPASSLSPETQEWLNQGLADEGEGSFQRQSQRREAKELLDWALAQVSAEDRMVLTLVHLDEYSVKEAAQMLGWSVANVKVRALRARGKLAKILAKAAA